MAALAPLVAALLAAGNPAVDAELRVEGRGGTALQGGPPVAAVQVEPSLTLTGGTDLRGTLSYLPRLLTDSGKEAQDQLLHRGRGTLEWSPDPLRRITLDEQFQWGTMDFSPLVSQQLADPRLATVRALPFVGSTSSLSWAERLSRRASLTVTGAWLVSGGQDAQAQQLIPLQRGPRAAAELRWEATRLDELSLSLDGSRSNFTSGTTVTLSRAAAGWRTHFQDRSTFELTAGAGAAADTRGEVRVRPLASAALGLATPARTVSGGCRVSLEPVVDPLGSSVYQRLDATASLSLSPLPSLQLTALGTGSRALEAATRGVARSLAQAEARTAFIFTPRLAVAAGVRGTWLDGADPAIPAFQWSAFVALAAGAKETL